MRGRTPTPMRRRRWRRWPARRRCAAPFRRRPAVRAAAPAPGRARRHSPYRHRPAAGLPAGGCAVTETVVAARPAPRLEREAQPAPRLEAAPVAMPILAKPPASSLGLVTGGVAVLILGLAALQTGNFVVAQFDRASWLGWLTLVMSAFGLGLIGAAISRDLGRLLSLRHFDQRRTALTDPSRAQSPARDSLGGLPYPSPRSASIPSATA